MWRLAAFLLAMPSIGVAQSASLVADRISIEADSRLVAEGNIEILYEDTHLKASRVVYDREAGTLKIDGPIVLTEGDDAIVLASAAELDERLERGILESARLVLNQQLQIAAAEMSRVDGRFSRLSRVTASSCKICSGSEVPLWEIRARRVIRDEQEQQLYFDEAQLRIAGVPVFYLPTLRLPDPSLKRASGFLPPRLRSRSQLSTGILVPYFVRLGDHADVTLTPYLSSRTTTLEMDFRREFAYGSLGFEGAVSSDEIRPGDTRGYLFAQGQFDLPLDFKLSFDLELVSDESYLFDYGYSDKDRLDSGIALNRTRDDQLFRLEATVYETLRASEIPIEAELPNEILEFDLRQRVFESPTYGALWAALDSAAIERASSDPVTGRDVSRMSFGLDWHMRHELLAGVVAEAEALFAYDFYSVSQDPAFDDQPERFRHAVAATLRWPLERTDASGARHLLEPMLQFAWSDTSGDDVPNEDSTVVEFDEGNLLSLSRFPGTDAFETGTRLNFGLGWTRYDPAGWSIGATFGRVYRFDDNGQFGSGSGLSGDASDWLLAVAYRLQDRIKVTSRSLLDSDLTISRSETRFEWWGDGISLAGTHQWRAEDVSEGRTDDLSELSLDSRFRLNPFWTASTEWRFDAEEGKTTEAGVGLEFANDCVTIDVSLSRRFTSSLNVEPATEFDIRVALTGLGTGGESRSARRRCTG